MILKNFKYMLFVVLLMLSFASFAQKKQNIIYILADDLGYGDLSCYGQKSFDTPTLDSLAANGIRFTQHYAGSSVCAPSRASLMTGRDPGHSWVRGNYEIGPYGFGAGLELRETDVTIAEVMKKAGYNTALIGKWGLGESQTSGAPDKQGFDYFYGFLNQAHAHYQFPDYLIRNGVKEEISANKNGKKGAYSGDLLTNDAINYLKKQNTDQPFFLYMAYIVPHAELLVPEDNLYQSNITLVKDQPFAESMQGSNGKDKFGAYRGQQHPAAAYATMVQRLDQEIKSIVNQLKRQGLLENTILMFSSDNGPHKEGGALPEYFNSSGLLRGAKRDLYEGGIRVPFIVSGYSVKQGVTTNHISAFWDILPTCADIAGVDLQQLQIKTEGISLVPLLRGKKNQLQHTYLYWEFHENPTTNQAVRKGKWKGIRFSPLGPLELYNLEEDPSEKNNVALANPQIVKELTKILDDARVDHPVWPMKK